MSFRVMKDGFTIEVNTESEFRTVLNNLGLRQRGTSLKPSDFVVDTNVLIELYKNIPQNTKAYVLLHMLKDKPAGLTTDELMKILDLDNGQALGGVFSGIAKHAKNSGVSPDDIYKWEFVADCDTYKLTNEMIKAIESASEKTNGEQD